MSELYRTLHPRAGSTRQHRDGWVRHGAKDSIWPPFSGRLLTALDSIASLRDSSQALPSASRVLSDFAQCPQDMARTISCAILPKPPRPVSRKLRFTFVTLPSRLKIRFERGSRSKHASVASGFSIPAPKKQGRSMLRTNSIGEVLPARDRKLPTG